MVAGRAGRIRTQDHVDRLREAWRRERPDVDTEGMAILGRARRIMLLTRGPIEAIFARFGCDAGEFDVLATLRRAGTPYRLRPTELYESLMISSGGLTDRMQRLETRGLIARRPSTEDKRSIMVELTPKGLEMVDAAFAADMRVEKELISMLSAAERKALAGLLAKLVARVESDDGNTGIIRALTDPVENLND
jgi:DNA-binding MarR family transcriptional regulator